MGIQSENEEPKTVQDLKLKIADTYLRCRDAFIKEMSASFRELGEPNNEWMYDRPLVSLGVETIILALRNETPRTSIGEMAMGIFVDEVVDLIEKMPSLRKCPECGRDLVIEGESTYIIVYNRGQYTKTDAEVIYRCEDCGAKLNITEIEEYLDAVDEL